MPQITEYEALVAYNMLVCERIHDDVLLICNRSAGIGYTGYNYEAAAIVASTTTSSKQSKDSKDHAAASLTFLHKVNQVKTLTGMQIILRAYRNKYMLMSVSDYIVYMLISSHIISCWHSYTVVHSCYNMLRTGCNNSSSNGI
jgi:hypothetical protein